MKQLDVVFIDADKISDLREQFRQLWHNEPLKLNAFISANQFALNNFNLIILGKNGNGFNIDVHNSIEKKTLHFDDHKFGYYGTVKNMHVITDTLSSHNGDLQQDIVIEYDNNMCKQRLWAAMLHQNQKPGDWICDLAIVFYAFNLLVMNLPKKIKEKTEQATKTEAVKKNGQRIYKPVVYLKHTYQLVDNFKLTKSDIHHIITCPAWGVRGHARHYKSGKIVYVKPYIKGKCRNDGTKYVAKTYKSC